MTDAYDLAWCRQRFTMMRDGAIWAVPRSGLIFTRRDNKLVLTSTMPYTEELAAAALQGLDVPPTEHALRTYQDADYQLIRRTFKQAGITVTREETTE